MRRFIPSLADLQAFEAAARHLNFTRAADELGVTQSAVSRNIGHLESYLGIELFDRAGPRLVLTELGATYNADVLQVLAKLEEVSIDVVRGRRAAAGLRIGSSQTMCRRWLAPLIEGFMNARPDMPFELRAIGGEEDFEGGEIDVAILRGTGQWPGARAVELFAEELVVVCAPEVSPANPARVDFASQRALQNSSRPSLWLTWFRLSGVSYSGILQGNRFSSSDMLVEAALRGLGMCVVPVHYVRAELANGRLVAPYGFPIRSGESYWLVTPERKWRDPRSQAFRTWLRKAA